MISLESMCSLLVQEISTGMQRSTRLERLLIMLYYDWRMYAFHTPYSILHPPSSLLLPPASCLLPPASCLLPPASCLLPPASCLLPPASCLLPPASCLLSPASCLLPPASCLLPPFSLLSSLILQLTPVNRVVWLWCGCFCRPRTSQ